MIEPLQGAIPFLLVDVLNPVLLALLVYATTSGRPVLNSSAMLFGHTLTYFVAGVALSFGVERISAVLENPGLAYYSISGVLGVFFVWWGLQPNKPSSEPDEPDWELTPLKSFGFGSVVNAIGLPFAVPYLGAIDQILKADLSDAAGLGVLAAYNLAYALPFAVVPLSILLLGEQRSKPLLEKMSAGMEWAADTVMPWLIFALGLYLIWDSINYFYFT